MTGDFTAWTVRLWGFKQTDGFSGVPGVHSRSHVGLLVQGLLFSLSPLCNQIIQVFHFKSFGSAKASTTLILYSHNALWNLQELIPLQRFGTDFRLRCSLPVSLSLLTLLTSKVHSKVTDKDLGGLQPGTYSYQFLVDGTWMTSPDAPVAPDDDGHLCNRVRTEDPLPAAAVLAQL